MTDCVQTAPQWSYALGNLVNSVAISPDATLVIAATYSHVYNVGGDQTFATYGFAPLADPNKPKWKQPLDTTSEGIYWVALSGNGKFAAAGGKVINTAHPKGAGIIQAFDASSGTVLLNFHLTVASRVNKVALSADGAVLVAVAGSSLYVSTWNGSAYSDPVATPLAQDQNWVDTVAISDDGSFIVAGESSGHVYLFRNSGGTLTPAGVYLMPNGATCRCAVFAPGGHWFAVSGGNAGTGGAVCLFNATAFEKTPAAVWMQQARGPIYYVTLPAAGELPPVVAAVTNTPWEIVHDEAAAEPLHTTGTPAGQVALLKVGAGAQPVIWKTFPTIKAPNSASFDPSGRYLAVADGYPPNTGTGNFYLLDGATLSCIWTYPTSKMNWPIQVAAGGGGVAAGSDDGCAYLFKTS